MENPSTWGDAERIVHNALNEFEDQTLGEMMAGLSLERRITDALRAAGLLTG